VRLTLRFSQEARTTEVVDEALAVGPFAASDRFHRRFAVPKDFSGGRVPNSVQAEELSRSQTFGAVLPDLMIEAVVDQSHPTQLCLHTWDGRKAATTPTVSFRGCTYTAAPVAAGLSRAVRFPGSSKAFGKPEQLTSSMLRFLGRYASLPPDVAALIVAFALSSWVSDCFPVAPLLYLLGPGNEATLLLRLMGCLCRRPILLSEVDIAALGTLPRDLDPTLLVNQRALGRRVTQVLLAANDRHFAIARGKREIYAYGAKAFASVPEFADATGVRVSLSPTQEPLPTLTDANEREIANDFQSMLLRFRMVNRQRVCDAEVDTRVFVPAMREEVRAWLASIYDCPDLYKVVSNFLLQQSREAEGDRMSDDRCVVAEAALFFCHRPDTGHFFVGELAEMVNALLTGRHDDRVLSDKKVGLLLRALGIHGDRVVKGYKVSLIDAVREQIHRVAEAYQVIPAKDGVARCPHCRVRKVYGGTN
jgi:hypothetical protein